MSEHDPLCPWNQPCPGLYGAQPHEFIPLDPPTLPPACYNCSSTECECDLIARVREDERGKHQRNVCTPCWFGGFEDTHDCANRETCSCLTCLENDARAAALRDAVEAVIDAGQKHRCDPDGCMYCVAGVEAVAAIEALGGEKE